MAAGLLKKLGIEDYESCIVHYLDAYREEKKEILLRQAIELSPTSRITGTICEEDILRVIDRSRIAARAVVRKARAEMCAINERPFPPIKSATVISDVSGSGEIVANGVAPATEEDPTGTPDQTASLLLAFDDQSTIVAQEVAVDSNKVKIVDQPFQSRALGSCGEEKQSKLKRRRPTPSNAIVEDLISRRERSKSQDDLEEDQLPRRKAKACPKPKASKFLGIEDDVTDPLHMAYAGYL